MVARDMRSGSAMLPRERYLVLGPEHFSEPELLALLLGTGAGRRTTRQIADDLLERFGGLRGLVRADARALARIRGVGAARAVRLHASLALGARACRALPESLEVVDSAAEAARWLGPALAGRAVEEVHALYLDRRLRPVRVQRLSVGNREASVLCPREVVRGALLNDATSVLLAHNHPSGDPEPSREDVSATRRVRSAAEAAGVQLVDHLVFAAPDRWVSMASRGLLR
jgi:DNA repair protein RadC